MTIVAGFSGFSGVILCSDSQETSSQYAKRSVEKIKIRPTDEWAFAIGGAGAGPYADMVSDQLLEALANLPDPDENSVRAAIQSTLAGYYSTHVWPRGASGDAPEVQLLIVAQPRSGGRAMLLHTSQTAVSADCHSKAIGIGAYLAEYILDHLKGQFSGGGDVYQMLSIATYVLKKTRDYIDGCGKESRIYLFGQDGSVMTPWPEDIQRIEAALDKFDEAVRDMFKVVTDATSVHTRSHLMNAAIGDFLEVESMMRQLVAIRQEQDAGFNAWRRRSKPVGPSDSQESEDPHVSPAEES